MSEQIPILVQTFIKKINESLNISIENLNQIFLTIEDNSDTDLYLKKIDELRNLCELHGLTKNGNKIDLINKLNSTNNPKTELFLKGTPILKDMCKKNNLKVTGNKIQLVTRLYEHLKNNDDTTIDDDENIDSFIQNLCQLTTDYTKMKKNELKQICIQKNLDSTGTKIQLIERLNNL